MKKSGNIWSIVLAGGEGTRLSHLTAGHSGRPVPKQYCSIGGGASLVRRALRRARQVAGADRTIVVVAEHHQPWWAAELADLPAVNVVVQPCNRGTACGVLLPLMQVRAIDPDSTVVVLPSDHMVRDETVLRDAIMAAIHHVEIEPDRLVLLGLAPDRPDTGLGWISPSSIDLHGALGISGFIEKPSRDRAEELIRQGALWNSFIFSMRAKALLALFERSLPWLTRMFSYAIVGSDDDRQGTDSLARLYRRLPSVDFSRAVLQEVGSEMRVVVVPPCGWNDIGTPDALARCAAWRTRADPDPDPQGFRPPLDLANVLDGYHDRYGPGLTD
ncbi:MAG: sugar phosphate nucleotidyltransferase [Thermoanaerobaculales bacterium]|jgi:mannose-1-phosphate guanylyltransferase|nr:sugar phosphate nucleotidyltransferase [Thermoanaerobaculales bacterium]